MPNGSIELCNLASHASGSRNGRTALLLRCTAEDAAVIRSAAKRERRTISAFILRCVLRRIAIRDDLRRRTSAMRLEERPHTTMKHQHRWNQASDQCVCCGKRRCKADQLATYKRSRATPEAIVTRCNRVAAEVSDYCAKHRYLQRLRRKLPEAA